MKLKDLQELLRAWAAADVKATAAEKLVTELQLSGERPSETMVLQALQLRAEATAARESVTRLVAG
jgi:hypothetical protein